MTKKERKWRKEVIKKTRTTREFLTSLEKERIENGRRDEKL
jgi:hypothetical protein